MSAVLPATAIASSARCILSDHSVDLYDNAYIHFASSAEAAVGKQTYGEDIGQSSYDRRVAELR